MTLYFTKPSFLVLFALATLLFWAVRSRFGVVPRLLVLLPVNLFFLNMLALAPLATQPPLLLPAGFACLVALLAFLCHKAPDSLKKQASSAGIALIVLAVLLLKYPTYSHFLFRLDPGALSPFAWLGISYMMFRSIDLILHVSRKRPGGFNALCAVNYLLFFLPFVSGPINRYDRFAADAAAPFARPSLDGLMDAAIRFSIGIIKIIPVGGWFLANSVGAAHFADATPTPLEFVLALYCFYLYIYANFSGYSDCCIAFSRLLGFSMPENFNHPYLARNLQDFWNRWHISLSHWFRDFLFFPSIQFLLKRFPKVSGTAKSNIAAFFTFSLMGLWHGDSVAWALYGVLLGSGTVASIVYNRFMSRRVKHYAALQNVFWHRALCAFVTNSYIVACLCVTVDADILRKVLAQL